MADDLGEMTVGRALLVLLMAVVSAAGAAVSIAFVAHLLWWCLVLGWSVL